jgi:hypothetical protein
VVQGLPVAPTGPSDRSGGKPPFADSRASGEGAPFPAIRTIAIKPPGATQSCVAECEYVQAENPSNNHIGVYARPIPINISTLMEK